MTYAVISRATDPHSARAESTHAVHADVAIITNGGDLQFFNVQPTHSRFTSTNRVQPVACFAKGTWLRVFRQDADQEKEKTT